MPVALERELERQADKKGLTGKHRSAYIYGTLRRTGWKPELSARFDQIVEFAAQNPFAKGYRRPIIAPYNAKTWAKNRHPEYVDADKGQIGAFYPGSAFDSTTPVAKKGVIVYPNTGATAKIMKVDPSLRKTFGNPARMSKAILRHELIHSLRSPESYGKPPRADFTKLSRVLDEAAVLRRELIGKKAKHQLKTSALARVVRLLHGLR